MTNKYRTTFYIGVTSNLKKRVLDHILGEGSKFTSKYNLNDYIISIIYKENNTIKVLNKINFNQEEDLKNISFQNLNIDNYKEADQLIESLKSIYENI